MPSFPTTSGLDSPKGTGCMILVFLAIAITAVSSLTLLDTVDATLFVGVGAFVLFIVLAIVQSGRKQEPLHLSVLDLPAVAAFLDPKEKVSAICPVVVPGETSKDTRMLVLTNTHLRFFSLRKAGLSVAHHDGYPLGDIKTARLEGEKELFFTVYTLEVWVWVGYLRTFQSKFDELVPLFEGLTEKVALERKWKVVEEEVGHARIARAAADSGLLTKEEFESLRKALLNKLGPERKDPLQQLAELFRLYRDGALSESEYNDRKWTLLGRI